MGLNTPQKDSACGIFLSRAYSGLTFPSWTLTVLKRSVEPKTPDLG